MKSKAVVDKKPTIKALEKAFQGDLDLVLFFLTWVKNGRNATEAYSELNPNVDRASAQVLGSRQLAKIDRGAVMESYGLGVEKYMEQLKEGLTAMRSDITGTLYPDHKARDTYHKRLGELLGIEKGGMAPIENNYYGLTDEQLDQLIASKRKQVGFADVIEGETEEDSGESS